MAAMLTCVRWKLTRVAATVEPKLCVAPAVLACPFADGVVLLNVAGAVADEIWCSEKELRGPTNAAHWLPQQK